MPEYPDSFSGPNSSYPAPGIGRSRSTVYDRANPFVGSCKRSPILRPGFSWTHGSHDGGSARLWESRHLASSRGETLRPPTTALVGNPSLGRAATWGGRAAGMAVLPRLGLPTRAVVGGRSV